jgi:hypothetical protein
MKKDKQAFIARIRERCAPHVAHPRNTNSSS